MGATHRQRSFWTGRITALTKDLRGSAAIQFGLVAPSLLLLLLGIMEIGRMLWTTNALHYSVEEAARCASINAATCGTSSKVQAFAAARRVIFNMRARDEIGDAAFHQLEEELDWMEMGVGAREEAAPDRETGRA